MVGWMRFVEVLKVRGVEVKLFWDSKVYKPSAATRLIMEHLPEPRDMEVLDLGTGSGVLAIFASKLGAKRVVATDVSGRALRTAEENLRLNRVENVELRLGNLYEPVEGERFHMIISNPPMTPSPRALPAFTWGGPDGRKVLDKVLMGAPGHLEEGGVLIVPSVSLVGIGRTAETLRRLGFEVRVLGYGYHPFGETLLPLKNHINRLKEADYFYDVRGRPCWRIVLFEAILRARP